MTFTDQSIYKMVSKRYFYTNCVETINTKTITLMEVPVSVLNIKKRDGLSLMYDALFPLINL